MNLKRAWVSSTEYFYETGKGNDMTDQGRSVKVEVEGNTVEAIVRLISDNRQSLLLDLKDNSIRYRDGAISIGFLALTGDGSSDDYTCLLTGAAARVTFI